MPTTNKEEIPVVILCGGRGTRLMEETQIMPKPLVRIGEKPILWHIMKIYSAHGFNNFILPVGYKGEKIKEYFLNYSLLQSDFTVKLNNHAEVVFHTPAKEEWKVTVVDTGLEALTGARLKKLEGFVPGQVFMLTYGDGVADVNIDELLEFHSAHGKIGTVTGVIPAPKYGELVIKEKQVTEFREKPRSGNDLINGGFFVFDRKFLEYVSVEDSCCLEREPLEKLAANGQLMVYTHNGFWQCMDTLRDVEFLNKLWVGDSAPWKIWEEK